MDYNDRNAKILRLLYSNRNVIFKEVNYEGIIYTAVFLNTPLNGLNAVNKFPLQNIIQIFMGRLFELKGMCIEFLAPDYKTWLYFTSKYNLKINFRYYSATYIKPSNRNIYVFGLFRDIYPPYFYVKVV